MSAVIEEAPADAPARMCVVALARTVAVLEVMHDAQPIVGRLKRKMEVLACFQFDDGEPARRDVVHGGGELLINQLTFVWAVFWGAARAGR